MMYIQSYPDEEWCWQVVDEDSQMQHQHRYPPIWDWLLESFGSRSQGRAWLSYPDGVLFRRHEDAMMFLMVWG